MTGTTDRTDDSAADDVARAADRWDDLPLLVSVPHAAKLIGVSRSAAYRLVASGELASAHMGGRVYVRTAAIARLAEVT